MVEEIKKSLHLHRTLLKDYREYYERLSEYLNNNDIEKYLTSTRTHHNALKKLFDKPITKTFKSLNYLIDIYKHVYARAMGIRHILQIMIRYDLQPVNLRLDVSQTKIDSLQDNLQELRFKYAVFVKTWQTFEKKVATIVKTEAADIMSANMYEAAVYIQKIFRESPTIVHLYAFLMQSIVDSLFVTDKKAMNKVLAMLDDDKEFFLTRSSVNKVNKANKANKVSTANPPINKFNLLPVTLTMDLQKLFVKIMPGTNGKISMEKYAKSNSTGFIVMRHVVYNPVEYNIKKIIKPVDKSLIQPVEYGVTEKIINRFNTIHQLDAAKWDFGTKVFDTPTTRAYFVIETLDGKNYRALAPWFESNTYAVPKHKLKTLLSYIANGQSRISTYQKLKTDIAIKNMFLPKTMDLTALADKSVHIDMQQIQNAVYESVMSVIKLNIKIKYASTIKSNTDINEIIHDADINNAFYHVILSKYSTGTELTDANQYSAGKFPFSELLVTYIRALRSITIRFMKELHNGYNRDPFDNSVFAQLTQNAIMDRLESVVKKAVLITVHHKTNIYSDMAYKYFLLNYTE